MKEPALRVPKGGMHPSQQRSGSPENRVSAAGAKQCPGARRRCSSARLIASAGVPEKQSWWEASATVAGECVVRPRPAKTLASNGGAELPFVSSRNGPREGCVVPAPSSPGARHAVRDQEAPLSPKPDTLSRCARQRARGLEREKNNNKAMKALERRSLRSTEWRPTHTDVRMSRSHQSQDCNLSFLFRKEAGSRIDTIGTRRAHELRRTRDDAKSLRRSP